MDTAVGAIVKLETKTGSYEGQIHAVDRVHNRLTLEKVYLTETKDRLPGRHHFFDNEITNIIVIEDAKPVKKVKEVRHGKSIIYKKRAPGHLSRLKELDTNSILLSKQDLAQTGDESSCNKGDGKSTNGTDNEDIDETENFHILTGINKQFMEAIDYLSKQKFLGFAAEGIDLSRNGKLCWIQMATRDEVILFDMISLGKNGIEAGIGKILECPDIQKIIHDCRNLSDMFFHQYGVKLINIFDTQVAAAVVSRNDNDGYFPTYVDSLPQCLSIYLNVDDDKLIWTKYRERRQQEDLAVWAERPARKSVVRLAARKVEHLLELRVALMEKMLEDFTLGVDIFLSIVRDSSAIELKHKSYKLQPHLLPHEFKNLQHEATRRKAQYSERYEGSKIWDCESESGNDFHDKCVNRDPTVVFSHDSLWHENTRKTIPWIHVNRRRGARANRQESNTNGSEPGFKFTEDRESDGSKSEGRLKLHNKSSEQTPSPIHESTKVVSQDGLKLHAQNSEQTPSPIHESTKVVSQDDDLKLHAKNSEQTPLSVHKNTEIVSEQLKVQQTNRDSDKDHLKVNIVDNKVQPEQGEHSGHTPESQVIGRSITDLIYNMTDDSEEEEMVHTSSHRFSTKPVRFIPAGYESMRHVVKPADAPIVLCTPSNSDEFETDYSVIPAHSGGRTSIFTHQEDDNTAISAANSKSHQKDCKDTKDSDVQLGSQSAASGRDVLGAAAGQPIVSPQRSKSSKMSTSSTLDDSNDSGNESSQAFNSPRKGIGRGAIMKAFAKNLQQS